MSDVILVPIHRRDQEPVYAQVDACDAERVKGIHWYLAKECVQACVTLPRPEKTIGRLQRTIQLSRLITGARPNQFVRFRNGDRMDFRKDNLAVLSGSELRLWDGPRGSSGYKGVKRDGTGWRASLQTPEGRVHLGRFSDPLDAALAFDTAARKQHGSSIKTNADLGLITSQLEKG